MRRDEYPQYWPGYYAVFFDDPINGIHWELAWVPKVPTPRQVWSFCRALRGFAKSRPDLTKTVPGVTWQARRSLPPRRSPRRWPIGDSGGMGRTDAASRVIEAPLTRVYAALVDPRALAKWLPPQGMTGRFEHFDASPGGSYRMTLTYADPPAWGGKSGVDSDIVQARFVEILPDDRVVQAVDFDSDDPSFAGTMIMTWTVTEVDAGTRVDMRADDVPPGISAQDHEAGMTSSLTNLATYLTGPNTDSST